MSKPSLIGALAMMMPLALLACSSDDDGPGTYTTIPAPFSKYCTGTLSADKELMLPADSGWQGGMDAPVAAAGSTFVLGDEFGGWAAFVFTSSGEPRMVDAEFGKGLTAGTDFTTDCALDGAVKREDVIFTEATLFNNEQLSGQSCKLPAGTPMTNFSFMNNLEIVKVSSDEIKQVCGWDVAWTSSLTHATLVVK